MKKEKRHWQRSGMPQAGALGDEAIADPTEGAAESRAFVPDEFRQMGYVFVDLMTEYLQGLEGRRVYGPVSPVGMDDLFAEVMPEDGCDFADIVEECRAKVFPNTMAIGSRRYFGMMNPNPLPVAVFADALCSVMNQNAASWRHAPAGTAIEKLVVRWLCEIFGLGQRAFGTLVPGGSLANLTGLKLAINRSLGRDLSQLARTEPQGPELSRLTFYVSAQSHYSFDKAVDMLGLGQSQMRRIPEDDLFRIDLVRLEESLIADREAGLQPSCIIGIAGTTNTGSVDKLDRLADLAARYGCWFHVDAAYGGAVMLSSRYRLMLQGIERADSITVDPHKWFYMPFTGGALLVGDGDFLRRSFLVHPEYYMEQRRREAEDDDSARPTDRRGYHHGAKVNFFQYGVQGSRRFDALKIWMAFKVVGRRKYEAWVEKDLDLARTLSARLRRVPGFRPIGPNTLGVCVMRWEPIDAKGSPLCGLEETDELNRRLQALIEHDGDAWFSHTILKGRVALRFNIENRRMTHDDISRLVEIIRNGAGRILEDYSKEQA